MMISAFQLFNPTVLNELPIDKWFLLGWSSPLAGLDHGEHPYCAWGAELSDDYYETRITGWRQAFWILGNVSVLTIPYLPENLRATATCRKKD